MAGKRGVRAHSSAGRALEKHDRAAHPQECPMLAISSSAIKTDVSAAGRVEPNAALSAQCLRRPGWQAWVRAGTLVVSLHGDWSVRSEGSHARTPERLLEQSDVRAIVFDSSKLGSWDSSLLIFLSSLREASAMLRVEFDESGLPAATRRLLALLRTEPQSPAAMRAHIGVVERFGEWTLARWADGAALVTLTGEAVLRAAPGLQGKVRARAGDLLNLIYSTSAAALPMLALVNVLVGAIVAFVRGIQLRRLGAEVWSNLIGVTEVREMAPLITAIVMSGRTGGAYAAQISAMQGSEEIDAPRALGPFGDARPFAADGAIVAAMADAVRQLADRIAATAEALPPRVAPDTLSGYPGPRARLIVRDRQPCEHERS
jgi:hypothetical protein